MKQVHEEIYELIHLTDYAIHEKTGLDIWMNYWIDVFKNDSSHKHQVMDGIHEEGT